MDTMQLILVIFLSTFIGISAIALLFFNAIFLIKRYYIKTDLKLKKKFNSYNNTSLGSNFKSVETIVNNNKSLMPIYMFLKDYHRVYSNQLEIVKIQLKNLSNLVATNKIIDIGRMIRKIKHNFDCLDKQQSEYKKFNLDTQKYSHDSSSISIRLFEIISEIDKFKNESLINISYKHIKKFDAINNNIKKISKDVNTEIECVNWENTHYLFLQELKEIKNIYKLSSDVYEIDKYRNALGALCGEIEKSIKNCNIATDKKVEFFKRTKTSEVVSNDLIKKIEQTDVAETIDIYKKEIIKLEQLLKEIKSDSLFCEIYNNNFEQFRDNLSSFYKIITERNIKDLYIDILKKFKEDQSVTELIHSNIDLINNINDEINDFNKMLNKNKDNIDFESSVNHMKEIYELIITFKNDNANVLAKIEKKNKDLLEIAFRINDYTIKLMDLERLMNENNVKNDEISQQIKMHINIINEIKNSIHENFKGIDQLLSSKLDSTQHFINDTLEVIQSNNKINLIIKKLELYSNRFKDPSTKSDFKKFDKLKKEKKYDELIDSYINFIQKNKKKGS